MKYTKRILGLLSILLFTLFILGGCDNPLSDNNENVNTDLAGLYVEDESGNSLSLNPAFDAGTTEYSVSLGGNESVVYITAGAKDSNATVVVAGESATGSISQKEVTAPSAGESGEVAITVESGGKSTTYTLTINREDASSEARLSDLQIGDMDWGGMQESFSSDTYSYTVTVADSESYLSITPTVMDANADITIEGDVAYSGSLKPTEIPQDDSIDIVVTAADSATTETYTLNVQRPPEIWLSTLSPDPGQLYPFFDGGTLGYTEYTLIVPDGTTAVELTAETEDTDARMYVYKEGQSKGSPDTTGSVVKTFTGLDLTEPFPVLNIDLEKVTDSAFVYSETEFAVTVRYPYSAELSGLSISQGELKPNFAADTTSYDVRWLDLSSSNAFNSIDITPELSDSTASLTIAGQSATSGEATTVSLSGETSIDIVVTAEDDSSKTYTLDVKDYGPNGWTYDSTLALSSDTVTPSDIATDADSNLYILDRGNQKVEKYNSSQTLVETWAISSEFGSSNALYAVAVDRTNGYIYVGKSDGNSSTIYQYDLDGTNASQFATGSAGTFDSVNALAVDPENGDLYVADDDDISYYKTDGTHQGTFDNGGTSFPRIDNMMFDSTGKLYISVNNSVTDDVIYQVDTDGSATEYYNEGDGGDFYKRAFYVDGIGNIFTIDGIPTYKLNYFNRDGGGNIRWSKTLEGGSTSSGSPRLDFAPDGTLYIIAKDDEDGVIVYTRSTP